MSVPIKYRMENNVNGEDIVLDGTGKLDDVRGGPAVTKLDIQISKVPDDWSSVIVPCICSGPGGGSNFEFTNQNAGLFAIAPNGYMTTPGTYRLASLYDERGCMVAAVRATGKYARSSSGCDFQIKVETRTKPKSVITEMSKIDHYSFEVHPHGRGRVLVYAHYSLSSAKGKRVFGWTTIYYDLIGVEAELLSPIFGRNEIEIQASGNALSYTTTQYTHPQSELGSFWSR